MSHSREYLIKRLNKCQAELDKLDGNVISLLAAGGPPPAKYDTEELITRLAKEVQYYRLHNKLYGG